MKTMAYMHSTDDRCVTMFEQGYTNPRELVLRSEAEALMLMNTSLQMQRDELAQTLELMCRAAMLNAFDGGASLMTYDTWGLGRTALARDAMKRALITIAKRRGKSTFGNDWQEALL